MVPADPRQAAETLRRRADAITSLILYGDLPSIDVEIAIQALREDVRRDLPDRLALFDMVYEARWQRLRDQGWSREGGSRSGGRNPTP
ncbi:MAG: hypothetical protein ACC662_00485 [Planctomycetota bacterium]